MESVIEYKDGKVVKVNGVPMPEYTLLEQLSLRIDAYCFWHNDYKDLTMAKVLEEFRATTMMPKDVSDILNFDDASRIFNKFNEVDRHDILYAPCGYNGAYGFSPETARK